MNIDHHFSAAQPGSILDRLFSAYSVFLLQLTVPSTAFHNLISDRSCHWILSSKCKYIFANAPGEKEILYYHAAGNLEMSQINMEHSLSLHNFMFLYCRADWGYEYCSQTANIPFSIIFGPNLLSTDY